MTADAMARHIAHEHGRSPFSDNLKEIVYGGLDGIITTFAVVSGFSGAALLGAGGNGEVYAITLVLLFGLANDLLWPSVILVVAISLGMALALAAVGIAAILGRRFVDRRVGESAARQHKVAAGLRIGAAAAVVLIGCALFTLTSSAGFR